MDHDLERYLKKSNYDTVIGIFKHYECPESCKSRCCKDLEVAVLDSDIKRFKKNNKLGKEVAKTGLKTVIGDYNELQQRFKSKPCPFLSDQEKCSIYKQRPFICTMYPFYVNPMGELGIIVCELGFLVFVDYLIFSSKVIIAANKLPENYINDLLKAVKVSAQHQKTDVNSLEIGALHNYTALKMFLHYLDTYPEEKRIRTREAIIKLANGDEKNGSV